MFDMSASLPHAPSDPQFVSLLASLSNSAGFPPNQLIPIKIFLLRAVIFRVFLRILPQLREPPPGCLERTMAGARGTAVLSEQFLQPLGDLFRRVLLGEAGGEAALRVHHIDD